MADGPDWYCAQVLPGHIAVDVVCETDDVLAFRPPVPGFGAEHIIVIPKQHVRSLLELDAGTAVKLLAVQQTVAAEVIDRHGGCQAITSIGDEQHNRHLHIHIAAGEGVARFIQRAPQVPDTQKPGRPNRPAEHDG
ncbi:HIT family protein [Streptomyces turgidiscabies]|uniref:HIT family protein n=1 Tax=Streptomyces turgidiscabies TaxID=85558 RepID=UPI0038F78A93